MTQEREGTFGDCGRAAGDKKDDPVEWVEGLVEVEFYRERAGESKGCGGRMGYLELRFWGSMGLLQVTRSWVGLPGGQLTDWRQDPLGEYGPWEPRLSEGLSVGVLKSQRNTAIVTTERQCCEVSLQENEGSE